MLFGCVAHVSKRRWLAVNDVGCATTYVLVARLCNAFNVRHNDLERHVGDERMQANVVLRCQEGRLAFASDVWLCELDSVSR